MRNEPLSPSFWLLAAAVVALGISPGLGWVHIGGSSLQVAGTSVLAREFFPVSPLFLYGAAVLGAIGTLRYARNRNAGSVAFCRAAGVIAIIVAGAAVYQIVKEFADSADETPELFDLIKPVGTGLWIAAGAALVLLFSGRADANSTVRRGSAAPQIDELDSAGNGDIEVGDDRSPQDGAVVSPASTPTPSAGWYEDPDDTALWRYWDGGKWTGHRSPR